MVEWYTTMPKWAQIKQELMEKKEVLRTITNTNTIPGQYFPFIGLLKLGDINYYG